MKTCAQYQAEMLNHLYGLLEAEDAHLLTAHLQECEPCRGAFAATEEQKKLLAEAAKEVFAGVRFEPPAPAQPSPQRVLASIGRPTAPARRNGGRYALAAGVLFLACAAAVGGAYWVKRSDFQQELAQARTQRDELVAERQKLIEPARALSEKVVRLNEQMRGVELKRQEKLVAEEQKIRSQMLCMNVAGPEKYEPGAVNFFAIDLRDLNNQPKEAQVLPRLVDVMGKEVVKAELLKLEKKRPGEYKLSLPPNIKANQDVFLEIVAKTDDATGEIREQLKLSRPVYLTHIATDKPMYQPGETVHFRSLTLNRTSLKPAEEDLRLAYTITSPNGEEVFSLAGGTALVDDRTKKPILGPDKQPVKGIGCGQFVIPPELAGGEYTLTVGEALERFPAQSRKFIVNKYEKPRLEKKLEFTGKSYGPGDEVVAACKVARSEGGLAVAHQPVEATVNIDGKSYGVNGRIAKEPIKLTTDANGGVSVRFKLPAQIERGEASLAVRFTDGGSVETIVRPIPIVLKKLLVQFYPEGGDLVAGVANRCYFQARTTLDKPAELKGKIIDTKQLDADKQVVARVQTLNDAVEPGVNQGMGVFEFTPAAGGKYALQVESPAGIEQLYHLPAVKDDGVVLKVPASVASDKDPLWLQLTSAQRDRSLFVGAYCRSRLLAHARLEAPQGKTVEINMKPEATVGGVYRVTVFEDRSGDGGQFVPVAERLIYRAPVERLKLSVGTQRSKFIPGEKVLAHCSASNEEDKPQPAILMVAVVDKSVINMADEKTHKIMPTHFLLTHEVRKPEDLEFADFLLTDHPKAPQALDLLLGTQGWRRFAEQDPELFEKKEKEEARRILAHIGYTPTIASNRAEMENLSQVRMQVEAQKVASVIQPEVAALRTDINKTQTELNQVQTAPQTQQQFARLQGAMVATQRAYQAAQEGLRMLNQRWLTVGGLALGVLLLVVGLGALVFGFMRQGRARVALLATATCLLVLVAGGLVWFNQLGGERLAAKLGGAAPDDVLAENAPTDFLERGMVHFDGDPAAFGDAEFAPPAPAGPGGGGGWGMPKGMAGPGRAGGRGPMAPMEKAMEPPRPMAAKAEPRPDAKPEVADLAAPAADRPALMKEAPRDARKAEVRLQGALRDLEQAQKVGEDRLGALRIANARKDKGEAEALMEMERAKRFGAEAGRQVRAQAGGEAKGRAEGRGTDDGVMARKELAERFNKGKTDEVQFRMRGFDKKIPAGMPAAGFVAGGVNGYRREVVAEEIVKQLPAPTPLVVREYAHTRSQESLGARKDFTETLYWNPVLVLPDGKAQCSFELCDSATSFEVLAYGHSLDGRIGAVRATIESRLPFSVEPKIPIEISANDKVTIPVTVANDTDDARPVQLGVDLNGMACNGPTTWTGKLEANQRTRHLYRLQPNIQDGEARLVLKGTSQPFAGDEIERRIRVTPEGFPIVEAKSDLLEGVARHAVTLPESWVNGTLKCQVQVYPSTLADLQKGLESLLREPNGCFEQTSSTNYPNLLILDYLRESDQASPETARRARELIERGYAKLTSFECQNQQKKLREGYEWFGGAAPPHEALTAYGLLQFTDLARVFPVDSQMLERTRTYLDSRKDGKGGFLRNARALDTFGRAPEDITNAYIVWALTESGAGVNVQNELATLRDQAKRSNDPYFVALVANSLINQAQGGDADDLAALLKKLVSAQKPDGHLDAERTSITGSGGRDLQIETTSLAILAWLKANRPAELNNPLQSAIKWLGQQRGGYGGFGATQSTILALKALIAHTKANKKTAEAGELSLFVGDQLAGKLSFPAGAQEALEIAVKDADKLFKPGKNDVRVEITGNNSFPHTLRVTYNTIKPASAEGCAVKLETKLDRAAANEGETVRLTASVQNTSGKGQGMTVAIIGLPAGLTLPEDFKQLKDYTRVEISDVQATKDDEVVLKPGLISAWETRGRELILYWRDLAPDKKIDVNLDLICRVPGEYRGPASRAYLYYNADVKHWVDPLRIDIKASEK